MRIELTGFGPKQSVELLKVVGDNEIEFRPIFRRKIVFGLAKYAREELNFHGTSHTFSQPVYPLLAWIKKASSIAFHIRRMTDGIFNGFTATLIIPFESLINAPYLKASDGEVWVLRSAGRHGLLLNEYRDQLEYGIRRKLTQGKIVITDAYISTSNSKFNKEGDFNVFVDNFNTNSIVDEITSLPTWHHAKTWLTLNKSNCNPEKASNVFTLISFNFDQLTNQFSISNPSLHDRITVFNRHSQNKIVTIAAKIKDAEIWNGSKIIFDEFLLQTELLDSGEGPQIPASRWPHENWQGISENLTALPHPRVIQDDMTSANYIPNNSNWHHFIEDICSRALVVNLDRNSNQNLVQVEMQTIQGEVFGILGISNLEILSLRSRVKIGELNFSIFQDNRKYATSEFSNQLLNVDWDLISFIHARLYQYSKKVEESPRKIYVKRRNNLFRRLINKSSLEKVLSTNNFQAIESEKLNLQSRANIFRNAEIVVLEAGAGAANLYFGIGTNVLLLLSPGMENSKEDYAMRDVCNLNITRIVGQRSNALEKMIFGVDSWKLRKSLFQESLMKIISG